MDQQGTAGLQRDLPEPCPGSDGGVEEVFGIGHEIARRGRPSGSGKPAREGGAAQEVHHRVKNNLQINPSSILEPPEGLCG